jgi:hypothetical protein
MLDKNRFFTVISRPMNGQSITQTIDPTLSVVAKLMGMKGGSRKTDAKRKAGIKNLRKARAVRWAKR